MFTQCVIQLQLIAVASLLRHSSALKYAAIKEANGSCFPKDTCSQPRGLDSLEEHNCDCGSLCSIYRTCCIDSPFLNHSRNIYRRSTCRTVGHGAQGLISVFVVDTCSDMYQGPRGVRRKCEEEFTDWSDPFANAPVTNPKTHTTYKSLFCALCNMEKPQSLAMWQVMLDCSSLGEFMHVCTGNRDFVLSNIMYVEEKNRWGLWSWDKKSDWKFRLLPIVYKMPKDLENSVTECRPNLISGCPPDWKDFEVMKLCKSYLGAVYFPQGAFRNIHCAICNRVKDLKDMSCHPVYSSPFRTTTALSFGLLLDIDLRDGDTVGVVNECQKGEVYDPFSKKCRSIECPIPGYKLKDGRCVEE